jgi:hypothetical protein
MLVLAVIVVLPAGHVTKIIARAKVLVIHLLMNRVKLII